MDIPEHGVRHFRAPAQDGTALIDPPLAEIPGLVESNQDKALRWDEQSGAPFSNWRRDAHRNLIEQCQRQAPGYFPQEGSTGRPPLETSLRNRPVVLSGHQPALFHPGVWFKNFLLSAVCQQIDAAGINLVIDNDLSRPSAIQVPGGESAAPVVSTVSLDEGIDDKPWEERAIADRNVFLSFRDRVLEAFTLRKREAGTLVLDPLWDKVRQRIAAFEEQHGKDVWHTPLRRLLTLGEILATARHELELDWGLRKCELPLSAVTKWDPFRTFASHLLTRAADFCAIHNAALHEYRLANGIRSHRHPVPELAIDGEWHEVPFWIWTFENRRRRRAFVRKIGTGWQLSDRMGNTLDERWVDPHGDEGPSAVRVRPRALVTTMYARLVLSDLFIHGIGGAKYDELTDAIIRRFFGIEPPAFMTATATFRLPIERSDVSPEDVRASARRLRELRYRPEAFLRDPLVRGDAHVEQKLTELAADKREYLATHDLRRCSNEVFRRLERLNEAMRELLSPVERELKARHDQLLVRYKQSVLLGSREFSFVLFPSETLPARLLDLCKVLS